MGAISTVTSFKITGIGFPMASLRWGKRKVWMYLLPVIAWSIVVNIPEIYTTVAYFTDIKVNINYLLHLENIYYLIFHCNLLLCNF